MPQVGVTGWFCDNTTTDVWQTVLTGFPNQLHSNSFSTTATTYTITTTSSSLTSTSTSSTTPSTSTSPTTTSTSSPTPTHTDSPTSTPAGPIAGGVVGGIALIIGAVVGFYIWRRKRRARTVDPTPAQLSGQGYFPEKYGHTSQISEAPGSPRSPYISELGDGYAGREEQTAYMGDQAGVGSIPISLATHHEMIHEAPGFEVHRQ